jgi:rRNA maturation endonuclease Nob1
VHRATILFSAGVAVFALAGCGGSSTLSHEDYVKQANAICTDYNKKVKSLAQPASVTEIETYARKVLVRYRSALAQLRTLKPSKDDVVAVDQWLSTDRQIEKDVQAIADAAQARRLPAVQTATDQARIHNQASDRLARELGLTACANG